MLLIYTSMVTYITSYKPINTKLIGFGCPAHPRVASVGFCHWNHGKIIPLYAIFIEIQKPPTCRFARGELSQANQQLLLLPRLRHLCRV